MATNLPFNGEFKITNEYRKPSKNYIAGFHTGIDLVGKTSKDVYSVCDGKVIMASQSYGEYGKAVKIKDNVTGKIFLFAHLRSIAVKVNQAVSRVTRIGVMGNTGNSNGAHLHIEMRTSADKYGQVEDIAKYMGIPNKEGTYNSSDYQIGKGIKYRVHIQDIGWQEPKENGEIAGTEGKEKRIEAIEIYSDLPIEYRAHVEGKGWLPWVKNGEMAGTEGEGRRLEAVDIKSSKPIIAKAHIQNLDWQDEITGTEIRIGTVGESLRLEALTLEYV